MKTVYKYSGSTYFALIFFLFILFLLVKIFISSTESGSLVYMTMTFLACSFWLKYTLKTLRNSLKKITVSSKGIHITMPLKKLDVQWQEIREFGRARKLGLLRYYWSYYVRTDKSGDKRIEIGEQELKGIEELAKKIFKQAKDARFVSRINVSPIPFLRKIDAVPWDGKEIV